MITSVVYRGLGRSKGSKNRNKRHISTYVNFPNMDFCICIPSPHRRIPPNIRIQQNQCHTLYGLPQTGSLVKGPSRVLDFGRRGFEREDLPHSIQVHPLFPELDILPEQWEVVWHERNNLALFVERLPLTLKHPHDAATLKWEQTW